MKDLHGKTAIVTGAANGIGRAIALSLADRGVNIVLVDIEDATLEEAAGMVEERTAKALPIVQDIASPDAFEKVRAAASRRFEQVDILINNAAVLCSGSLEDIPIAQWERMIDVNLLAIIRSTKLFVPEMTARGSGHIVNTSSFAALFPYSVDRMPYVTTKAAVVSFTESLALYVKPYGVGVTLLLPGPVRTDIASRSRRFSPNFAFRGPGSEFEWVEPEQVGEMVADAIENDIFFLPTDEKIAAKMQARAADPEAFIAAQIAQMASQ